MIAQHAKEKTKNTEEIPSILHCPKQGRLVYCAFTPPDLKVDKPNTGPPNQPPQSWTVKCFEFVFKAVYFSMNVLIQRKVSCLIAAFRL